MPAKRKEGRPPDLFSDDDCHRIGKDLLIWLKSNLGSNDIVHLSQFYVIIEDMDRGDWKCLCDRKEFTPYYEKALDLMAAQTMLNQNLSSAYGSRFIARYSKDLRDFETQEKKEELARRKELIDHETDSKANALSAANEPPRAEIAAAAISVSKLTHENKLLREQLDALQSKTKSVDMGSQ